jgi:hypothetical protein
MMAMPDMSAPRDRAITAQPVRAGVVARASCERPRTPSGQPTLMPLAASARLAVAVQFRPLEVLHRRSVQVSLTVSVGSWSCGLCTKHPPVAFETLRHCHCQVVRHWVIDGQLAESAVGQSGDVVDSCPELIDG